MRLTPSGDGIAAVLLRLESLEGGDLSDQRLVNVRFADRATLPGAVDAIAGDIEAEAAALAGRGRVLVRPSGTEPLVRVVAERRRGRRACEPRRDHRDGRTGVMLRAAEV